MSNLQTILVAVFLSFFVFAVLIFSGLIKTGSSSTNQTTALSGKIVIWGTFSNTDMAHAFERITDANQGLSISYVPKDAATYQQALIEAFANGTGPDLFFMTPDMIQKFSSFAYKIPYTSYPQKTFTDSFIDGASIYLASDGAIGFPVAVDPTVLYYNKDLFSNAGIAQTPVYWDELFNLNSRLTQSKDDGTILQSMIALGRFDNVSHAKDILATLLLQNGNTIVGRTDTGTYETTLNNNSAISPTQANNVLFFYTEFATPSDGGYSWNSALPQSIDMFTGGKLAMYVGKASELFKIQSTNPNLSFDVTTVLQTRNTVAKRTYGTIYAVAANKSSKNVAGALGVAGALATGDNALAFSQALSLPPALKSLLAVKPQSPYMLTFFNSAIFTQSWLDPNTTLSDAIFAELVQNILSNKLSVGDALAKAQNQLELLNNK